MYKKVKMPLLMGDTPSDATAPVSSSSSISDLASSGNVKTAAAIALTYHGYKRAGLFGALIYGLAGRLVPVVAVPVAIAQGFGKKRVCTTE